MARRLGIKVFESSDDKGVAVRATVYVYEQQLYLMYIGKTRHDYAGKEGHGNNVIRQILDFADEQQKTVALMPAADTPWLEGWYRRLGFSWRGMLMYYTPKEPGNNKGKQSRKGSKR